MPPSLLRQSRRAFNHVQTVRPFLRHVSFPAILLVIVWIYAIHFGEREAFLSKISQCDWTSWETWPTTAQPHRAVLIADPQLVDAHTYPGRPFPLSTLTKKYTDRYMARSFKMINALLDPDSVIFLGDMFDGGREWAPAVHRPLTKAQQWVMEARSPATSDVPTAYSKVEITDAGWERDATARVPAQAKREAMTTEVDTHDIMKFEHGENGRWRYYSNKYWEKEYNRFGKIFLAHDQLYPASNRQFEIVASRGQEECNIENGARNRTLYEYGTVGGKTRTLLSSLPGNHDLGFGSGVQLPIRARYKWHFGDLNRVDVLGNHTLVSVDALSLAAWSQFEPNGRESSVEQSQDRKHIYEASQAFLDTLPSIVDIQTRRALRQLYPGTQLMARAITSPDEANSTQRQAQRSTSVAQQLPVVLLTHVPLYREPNVDCGTQRERGHALSITGGYQYQNVLTQTLSNAIARKLGRAGSLRQVFSGDDHDYCNVTHKFETTDGIERVREETVKSFSWAMGVRHPGFMMVSLWNPVDETGEQINSGPTIQSHLCLLPDQLAIFIRYACLAGVTMIVLLVRAIVLSLRSRVGQEEEEYLQETSSLKLSKLIPSSLVKLKGLAKGYKSVSHGRHRASSSGLRPPSNNHLSIQRSPNARARSVSPGVGYGAPFANQHYNTTRSEHPVPHKEGPLINQAGYYPQLKPKHDSSRYVSDDEESRIGDDDYLEHDDDTQAKWRRRRRPKGKLTRAWDDFSSSMLFVAGITGTYYLVLIRNG